MEGGDGMSVLQVRQLRLRRGTRDILAGLDLDADRGELVVLMGLSGAGKTTVLRVIAGLETPDAGQVSVDGVDITAGHRGAGRRQRHRKIGMVFQSHALFEHLTALENVTLAPIHVQQQLPAEAMRRAQALLDQLGVGERAGALPRELSGGEAQRVAIARSLAMDPPLLLLDEPTASLDPARRTELGRSLQALAASGRALVLTSHDEDFVREFAHRVVILSGGLAVEAGDPASVLDRPIHDATRALLQRERPPRG